MDIYKRDAFALSRDQQLAGRKMWDRSSQHGRLAKSSFDAEANAPKTWIIYVNNKGEELSVIECELYIVGRHSNAAEAIVMLHGMCPKCGETFIAREDNKTMQIDRVRYRKAPKVFRVHWSFHCQSQFGRSPRDSDMIALVSSPERWACDYCRSWCVRVQAGVATDDHRGVTQITVPVGTPLIGDKPKPKGVIEF